MPEVGHPGAGEPRLGRDQVGHRVDLDHGPGGQGLGAGELGSRLIPSPWATAAATTRRSGATSRRSAWNGRPSAESQNRRVMGSSAL